MEKKYVGSKNTEEGYRRNIFKYTKCGWSNEKSSADLWPSGEDRIIEINEENFWDLWSKRKFIQKINPYGNDRYGCIIGYLKLPIDHFGLYGTVEPPRYTPNGAVIGITRH